MVYEAIFSDGEIFYEENEGIGILRFILCNLNAKFLFYELHK